MLVALGLKKTFLTLHTSPADALHGVALWALTGGLALYLVALSSLRRRNLGSWNRQRLVLAALLLALTPLLGHVPAALLLLIVTAAVLLLIAFERTSLARRPVAE